MEQMCNNAYYRNMLKFILICSAISLGINGFWVITEYIGIGRYRFEFIILGVLVFLIGMISSFLLALIPRTRRNAVGVFVFTVIYIISLIIMIRLSGLSWELALNRVVRNSVPLITAIKSYTRENGAPPSSLPELVPKYISTVPNSGLMMQPSFDYTVFSSTALTHLYWYDLGSRGGRDFQGLWVYIEGDLSHAILVFTTSKDGIVQNMGVDRFPDGVEKKPFDPDRWREDPDSRMVMVHDLFNYEIFEGQPISDVIKVLGDPNGERVLLNASLIFSVTVSSA